MNPPLKVGGRWRSFDSALFLHFDVRVPDPLRRWQRVRFFCFILGNPEALDLKSSIVCR